MNTSLWHETTLTVGVLGGMVGFFRGLEQRKDTAFAEMTARLCNPQSEVLRASAARELPAFHAYRRFVLGKRPFRAQSLELALNALKVEGQNIFVRQALVESLQQMLPNPQDRGRIRLDYACLENLIMIGFDFEDLELTHAKAIESGLERARFARANLWHAKFCGSNLQEADFSETRLWDADLSRTDLRGARLLTAHVNENTRLDKALLSRASLSREVAALCRKQGCDMAAAQVQ
jgi:Pentapeptide repeats (8 copies)